MFDSALAVVIALAMVEGLTGADSWRDGELFLEPGVIAAGAVAFALSCAGFAAGLAAHLRPGSKSTSSLVAWALSATVLAVLLAAVWLFVVFVSASSD